MACSDFQRPTPQSRECQSLPRPHAKRHLRAPHPRHQVLWYQVQMVGRCMLLLIIILRLRMLFDLEALVHQGLARLRRVTRSHLPHHTGCHTRLLTRLATILCRQKTIDHRLHPEGLQMSCSCLAHGLRPQCSFLPTCTAYVLGHLRGCLLYTSPSPRDGLLSRMPSSA